MSSATEIGGEHRSACVACLETIQPGATTCPHCGSSQVPHRWQIVSQVLKWIGGIVTTISLVVGVITLSQYYLDWREQRANIAEIVAAADWLIESESYLQAWQLYARAAEINPSSQLVRDARFRLSLRWVRDFRVDSALLDKTLNEISETLYRGLPGADAQQTATILAHVGDVQSIRQVYGLPVYSDVESLFARALSEDVENVYANAMYARWLLLQKPMTVERLRVAAGHFEQAMNTGLEADYVRPLQLRELADFSHSFGDEMVREALTILLKVCLEMLDGGEDPPAPGVLSRILDGYDRRGNARHVEALLSALPPGEHLRVYEWLLGADDESREVMLNQSNYVRARLNEQTGNEKQALRLYRELVESSTRDEISALVDQGLQRLTGELPARALARNYRDDPVDETNPFQFHLDTLEHFDPEYRGENFTQALNYFENQVATNPQGLTALQIGLPTFIERVRENLRQGDEIEQLDAYTSGFNSWHHDNVRQRWIDLVRLHARLLGAGGKYEAALARLGDVSRGIARLDDGWQPTKALLQFEIAELYALLAARSGKRADLEQAIVNLQDALDLGLIDSKMASWRDVKGETFAPLADDPRYQDLVRGR